MNDTLAFCVFLWYNDCRKRKGAPRMYKTLSSYLKERYGRRISKICIDGGFGCPNRDGAVGHGGCIYCGERGAGEHIDALKSIEEQVDAQLARGKADGYIAYFQNFTNTYAPVDVLRERYTRALRSDKIVALAIGTRPDCITDEIAELIATFKDRVDVWVELGLQTASDDTALIINRGYKTEVYYRAADILTSHGIPFVTHMIIGLPGESEDDIDATVDAINAGGSWGVKIHSIYVMEGTRLCEMYRNGAYIPPTKEWYVEMCARSLSRLRGDIVVHRITGDCPRDMLVAPDWNICKNEIINEIREKYLELMNEG